MDTYGRSRLIEVCERRGVARSVARQLGAAPATISRWLDGTTRPEPHLRAALERLFGIPADAWMTDDERTVAFGELAAAENGQ